MGVFPKKDGHFPKNNGLFPKNVGDFSRNVREKISRARGLSRQNATRKSNSKKLKIQKKQETTVSIQKRIAVPFLLATSDSVPRRTSLSRDSRLSSFSRDSNVSSFSRDSSPTALAL